MDPESGTTNYVPVRAKAYPASKNALSVDAKFWRSFRNKSAPQQISAVTCIQFSPAEPHDFAVTSSTRVRQVRLLGCVSSSLSRDGFRGNKQSLTCAAAIGIIFLAIEFFSFSVSHFSGVKSIKEGLNPKPSMLAVPSIFLEYGILVRCCSSESWTCRLQTALVHDIGLHFLCVYRLWSMMG